MVVVVVVVVMAAAEGVAVSINNIVNYLYDTFNTELWLMWASLFSWAAIVIIVKLVTVVFKIEFDIVNTLKNSLYLVLIFQLMYTIFSKYC